MHYYMQIYIEGSRPIAISKTAYKKYRRQIKKSTNISAFCVYTSETPVALADKLTAAMQAFWKIKELPRVK